MSFGIKRLAMFPIFMTIENNVHTNLKLILLEASIAHNAASYSNLALSERVEVDRVVKSRK